MDPTRFTRDFGSSSASTTTEALLPPTASAAPLRRSLHGQLVLSCHALVPITALAGLSYAESVSPKSSTVLLAALLMSSTVGMLAAHALVLAYRRLAGNCCLPGWVKHAAVFPTAFSSSYDTSGCDVSISELQASRSACKAASNAAGLSSSQEASTPRTQHEQPCCKASAAVELLEVVPHMSDGGCWQSKETPRISWHLGRPNLHKAIDEFVQTVQLAQLASPRSPQRSARSETSEVSPQLVRPLILASGPRAMLADASKGAWRHDLAFESISFQL